MHVLVTEVGDDVGEDRVWQVVIDLYLVVGVV